MNKEQSLEFVKGEINQYRSIQDRHEKSIQTGYVNGLNSAFLRVGYSPFMSLMNYKICLVLRLFLSNPHARQNCNVDSC